LAARQSDTIELHRGIEALVPGAHILSVQDVDGGGCDPLGQSPGLVRLDLNGDGAEDYAVLLKLRQAETTSSTETQRLRIAFILFISDGKGNFSARTVRTVVDTYPVGLTLDMHPAGVVRNRSWN